MNLPQTALSTAGTTAFNCVALTKEVASALPDQLTVELWTKPLPVTVTVKGGPPASNWLGAAAVMVGVTLTILKLYPLDVAPPETTVIVAVPGLAIKLAGTVAANCVPLTYTVVRAEPFHCTVLPRT